MLDYDMLAEKAKDLGRSLGQSNEYQALKRASDRIGADADASAAMRRLAELRGAAEAMIQRGENPPEEMEEQLDSLLRTVQGMPIFGDYDVAQTNFDKLMLRVNEHISEGIRTGAVSKIITLT